MISYYAGWLAIFIIILTITHILSKYTREIFLWTIKVSIALIITFWLGLAVYINENLDIAQFNASVSRVFEQIAQLRAENAGL
jgi:hypothetical protein